MRDSMTPPRPFGAAAGDGWYGAMTQEVIAFLGRLRAVPTGAWAAAAERDRHSDGRDGEPREGPAGVELLEELQADRLARAHLRDAMESMPEVVRRIRLRIDDALSILDGIARPATASRMRRAARLAACAIAARPLLSADEFDRLYRPFETLIPSSPTARDEPADAR